MKADTNANRLIAIRENALAELDKTLDNSYANVCLKLDAAFAFVKYKTDIKVSDNTDSVYAINSAFRRLRASVLEKAGDFIGKMRKWAADENSAGRSVTLDLILKEFGYDYNDEPFKSMSFIGILERAICDVCELTPGPAMVSIGTFAGGITAAIPVNLSCFIDAKVEREFNRIIFRRLLDNVECDPETEEFLNDLIDNICDILEFTLLISRNSYTVGDPSSPVIIDNIEFYSAYEPDSYDEILRGMESMSRWISNTLLSHAAESL